MLARMRKREPCVVGGNVNWHSHYGETVEGSKTLEVESADDSKKKSLAFI